MCLTFNQCKEKLYLHEMILLYTQLNLNLSKTKEHINQK